MVTLGWIGGLWSWFIQSQNWLWQTTGDAWNWMGERPAWFTGLSWGEQIIWALIYLSGGVLLIIANRQDIRQYGFASRWLHRICLPIVYAPLFAGVFTYLGAAMFYGLWTVFGGTAILCILFFGVSSEWVLQSIGSFFS